MMIAFSQEEHARELRDLEAHHSAAGAAVAARGEALLMQQARKRIWFCAI
jgi:hypothetical protein